MISVTTARTSLAALSLSLLLLSACGGGDAKGRVQPPQVQPIEASFTATVAAYETARGSDLNNFEPVGFDLKFSIPMDKVKGGTWRVVGPLGELGGSIRSSATDDKSLFFEASAPLYPHAEYRIEILGLEREDGVPITVNTPVSVRVPVRETMALGDAHACVLRNSGRIRCWGRGAAGVLGTGSDDDVGDETSEMGSALIDVDLGTDPFGIPLRAVELVAGSAHNCARIESGEVKCWGSNLQGQLGRGDDVVSVGAQPDQMGNALPAVKLGSGRTAVYLAAGLQHTCAALDNGQLKCWGNNAHGALGAGVASPSLGLKAEDMGDALPAVNLGAGAVPVQVSAATHTCALLQQGRVKCWGDNAAGQLGLGDMVSRGQDTAQMGDALPPVDLGGSALRVAAGVGHTCAALVVGVRCWGSNQLGVLGVGDETDRGGKPGDMGNALPSVGVLGQAVWAWGLKAGQRVTCAKLDDRKLYCWGDGSSGQLGLGSAEPRGDKPEHLSAGAKAVLLKASQPITDVAIAPSGLQVCARLRDDGYHCWGSNVGFVVLPGAGFKELVGDETGDMVALKPIDLGAAEQ